MLFANFNKEAHGRESGSASADVSGVWFAVPETFLLRAAYALLVAPVFVFFAGCLRIQYSIVLSALLASGIFLLMRSLKTERVLRIRAGVLTLLLGTVFVWCLAAGQGGFLPQTSDHVWRNPLFYDLIHCEWPVSYNAIMRGKLVYYFLYWMIPASVGKLAMLFSSDSGEICGHAALLLWTWLNVSTVLLLLICRFQTVRTGRIMLLTAVFILFSGMDALGWLVRFCFGKCGSFPEHLEMWMMFFQYSSVSTQLFWVFNQAVPAWLCTTLLLVDGRVENYGVLCALIFAFAPFPAVGFCSLTAAYAVICFIQALKTNGGCSFARKLFSPCSALFAVALFPAFLLFYSANERAGGTIFSFALHDFKTFAGYLLFVSLEFLPLSVLLLPRSRDWLFYLSVIQLLVIPCFLVISSDFVWRASIPALFVLMFFLMKYFLEVRPSLEDRRFLLISLICIIGSATPLVEFARTAVMAYKLPRSLYRCEAIGSFAKSHYPPGTPFGITENFISRTADGSFFFKHLAKKPCSKRLDP